MYNDIEETKNNENVVEPESDMKAEEIPQAAQEYASYTENVVEPESDMKAEEIPQATQEYTPYYANMAQPVAEPVRPKKAKKEKKAKKSHKVLAIIAAALCFGVIAGASAFGVSSVLKRMFPTAGSTVVYVDPLKEVELPMAMVNTSGDGTNEAQVIDVADVVDAVMPSVVSVTSRITQDIYFGYYSIGTQESDSSGSGIIIGQNDTEILIVTNNHVVEGNEGVSVQFIDNEIVSAVVKGTAPDIDIAVLAVDVADVKQETMQNIRIAKIGNSETLRLGERVIAVGNALGLGQAVTQGGVSALDRTITVEGLVYADMIQTDAAINSGNSGGALINMYGEVVGINSAKCSATGVEGIGYAIPISSIVDVINDLMKRETRKIVDEEDRGYIGIGGYAVDSSAQQRYGTPAGISVQYVEEGSAAEAAGIQQFDIITKFDGQKVGSVEDLQALLQYYRAGETVKITISYMEGRQYVEEEIDITLGRAPQE